MTGINGNNILCHILFSIANKQISLRLQKRKKKKNRKENKMWYNVQGIHTYTLMFIGNNGKISRLCQKEIYIEA